MMFLILLLLTSLTKCNFDIRPVPWITEQAIIFLESLIGKKSDLRVLEFGCGASTCWLSRRTRNLVSVEHSPEWYEFIKSKIEKDDSCYKVNLIRKDQPYYDVCDDFPDEYFDLIIVDGRNRKGCIVKSIKKLKRGGVLMLDNSERDYYRAAINLMHDWNSVVTVQKRPDSCNFTYPNWSTSWWVKP